MDTFIIRGRKCSIWEKGSNGPVVLCPTFALSEEDRDKLLGEIEKEIGKNSLVLVTYEVADWNGELSPWPAISAFGEENFSGGAPGTLDIIEAEVIPQIEHRFGLQREKYIIGYSLAGLFSLWCAYNSNLFNGAGSCSGSLWYEGWKEYIDTHKMNDSVHSVYLSLGGKEEQTDNRIMARVGDVTRYQESVLKSDENIKNVILEWNKGGHFSNSFRRLAKGIGMLISIH